MRLLALGAFAAHLDHRALGGEARGLGGGAHPVRQPVVVDMDRVAATVADQENAVVEAARMAVGDKGVGAFDAADQIIGDEQVEDSVNAVRRNRSEEHTSELQSLMRISYAVFCLKKKTIHTTTNNLSTY